MRRRSSIVLVLLMIGCARPTPVAVVPPAAPVVVDAEPAPPVVAPRQLAEEVPTPRAAANLLLAPITPVHLTILPPAPTAMPNLPVRKPVRLVSDLRFFAPGSEGSRVALSADGQRLAYGTCRVVAQLCRSRTHPLIGFSVMPLGRS
jgi:hypothetical protein